MKTSVKWTSTGVDSVDGRRQRRLSTRTSTSRKSSVWSICCLSLNVTTLPLLNPNVNRTLSIYNGMGVPTLRLFFKTNPYCYFSMKYWRNWWHRFAVFDGHPWNYLHPLQLLYFCTNLQLISFLDFLQELYKHVSFLTVLNKKWTTGFSFMDGLCLKVK